MVVCHFVTFKKANFFYLSLYIPPIFFKKKEKKNDKISKPLVAVRRRLVTILPPRIVTNQIEL
ncbi:hypothetical protein EFM15_04565 [Lactobacillus delbrueckii]|nr:hypothetical protein [Lactobacillus delbrueckii]